MGAQTMPIRDALLRKFEHCTVYKRWSLDGKDITSFSTTGAPEMVQCNFADGSKRILRVDTDITVEVEGDPYPAFDPGI